MSDGKVNMPCQLYHNIKSIVLCTGVWAVNLTGKTRNLHRAGNFLVFYFSDDCWESIWYTRIQVMLALLNLVITHHGVLVLKIWIKLKLFDLPLSFFMSCCSRFFLVLRNGVICPLFGLMKPMPTTSQLVKSVSGEIESE